MKKISLFFALALMAISTPFISLSNSYASLNSHFNFTNQTPPPDMPTSGDKADPEHSIHENDHGVEGMQIAIVAGSIIIAAGLAIGISKRRKL
jgi:hypothetical protein